MTGIDLKERIRRGPLLLDGAMGTRLFAHGVEPGKCNDYLNIESPDVICDIHGAYLEAGSDAVLTNTFGACRCALARHGLAEQASGINEAGARIARKAAGQDRYVLGNIGPAGDLLEPLGQLKPDELRDAVSEQAKALLDGGVDGFIIETMADLEEITIAVEAVKSVAGGLPVLASMSFDKASDGFRTMMGVSVEAAVSRLTSLGVDAAGFNCGTLSLDEYVTLAEKLVSSLSATSGETIALAEPNAGKPELVDGQAVYRVSPEDFAAAARKIHSAGVGIIGGCCGTGPEHIKTLAATLREDSPASKSKLNR